MLVIVQYGNGLFSIKSKNTVSSYNFVCKKNEKITISISQQLSHELQMIRNKLLYVPIDRQQ